MKIEIGKRYVTRDGRITTPLIENEFDPLKAFPFKSDIGNRRHFHTREGGHYASGGASDDDLVAEYVEPLKLEEGKRYVLRDGSITDPLIKNESSTWAFCGKVDYHDAIMLWKEDGTWNTLLVKSARDIVREYLEPGCNEPVPNPGSPDDLSDKIHREQAFRRLDEIAGKAKLLTGTIGRINDTETDLKEAIAIIAKQEAEIQAYRTLLKEFL